DVNQVNIDNTALVEAGLDNRAVVRVLAVKVQGVVQDDLLPGNGLNILDRLNSTSDVPGVGRRLTDAELANLDTPLPAGLKYEYAFLDVSSIAFSISQDTIIQVMAGANQGGIVGDYYQYKPNTTDGSHSVFLEKEDYSNTTRWTHLGATLTAEQQLKPNYPSN